MNTKQAEQQEQKRQQAQYNDLPRFKALVDEVRSRNTTKRTEANTDTNKRRDR